MTWVPKVQGTEFSTIAWIYHLELDERSQLHLMVYADPEGRLILRVKGKGELLLARHFNR